MSYYLWGGGAVLLAVLVARSYFGKKYGSTVCRSCKNCPYAQQCTKEQDS